MNTERSAEEKTASKLEAARNALSELEARFSIALATQRLMLNEVEEENRHLHREAARRDFVVFTETEFARIFKVSQASMARERLDGKITPLMIRGKVRYTSEHLERAHELFGAKPAKQPRKLREVA